MDADGALRTRDATAASLARERPPVSESAQPSMQDILDAFERLAERVAEGPSSRLDPFVAASMRRACEELRRFIPGLDAPPDPEAAN